jgi:hypothetical protein
MLQLRRGYAASAAAGVAGRGPPARIFGGSPHSIPRSWEDLGQLGLQPGRPSGCYDEFARQDGEDERIVRGRDLEEVRELVGVGPRVGVDDDLRPES